MNLRTYGETLPEGTFYACDVEPRPIVMWEWGSMGLELSVGDLNLFAGHPGALKTTLACQIAAQMTRRDDDGPNGVLIITEEDIHKATRPRLEAMGANLERVLLTTRGVAPAELLTMVRNEGLGLIVADPVQSLFGGIDPNSNPDVRALIETITQTVLVPHGCILLGLVHFAKSLQRDTGLGRMMGASTLGQMARQVYMLGRSLEDGEEDIVDVADEKHSYTPLHATVRHRIVPFVHPRGLVRLEEVARIHRTSAEVVANKPSAHAKVETWILDKLATRVSGFTMDELAELAKAEISVGRTKVRSTCKALHEDTTCRLLIDQKAKPWRVLLEVESW